jgi:hypothetical protein
LTVAGDIMGLGRSTAHKYFLMFLNAVKHSYRSLISIPTGQKLRDHLSYFTSRFKDKGAKWVPKIIGAVDGTHIFIHKPSIDGEAYWCYKQKHSVILQVGFLSHCIGEPLKLGTLVNILRTSDLSDY